MTGIPCHNTDLSMERGSVLLNLACLYTQLAAREDRGGVVGLTAATEHYLSAAGVLQFILTTCSAGSGDLGYHTLHLLLGLVTAQARETRFTRLEMMMGDSEGLEGLLQLGQEAGGVGQEYDSLLETAGQVRVPYSWVMMVQVKQRHYLALAEYYVATALLGVTGELGEELRARIINTYTHTGGVIEALSCLQKLHHLGMCYTINNILYFYHCSYPRKSPFKRSFIDP